MPFFNSNGVWVLELINMEVICETGPTVYRPYPRTLESLTICWSNYKGSTFYSVILRPWVLARPESNSRLPAWQPDVPRDEPPVRSSLLLCANDCESSDDIPGNCIREWDVWRPSFCLIFSEFCASDCGSLIETLFFIPVFRTIYPRSWHVFRSAPCALSFLMQATTALLKRQASPLFMTGERLYRLIFLTTLFLTLITSSQVCSHLNYHMT